MCLSHRYFELRPFHHVVIELSGVGEPDPQVLEDPNKSAFTPVTNLLFSVAVRAVVYLQKESPTPVCWDKAWSNQTPLGHWSWSGSAGWIENMWSIQFQVIAASGMPATLLTEIKRTIAVVDSSLFGNDWIDSRKAVNWHSPRHCRQNKWNRVEQWVWIPAQEKCLGWGDC